MGLFDRKPSKNLESEQSTYEGYDALEDDHQEVAASSAVKKPMVTRLAQATWNWIKANKWGLLASFLVTAAIAGLVFGGIMYYPMALFALEMVPYVGIGIAKLAFAASTIPQAAVVVASIAAGFTAAAITSIWLFVGACKLVFHKLLSSHTGEQKPPAGAALEYPAEESSSQYNHALSSEPSQMDALFNRDLSPVRESQEIYSGHQSAGTLLRQRDSRVNFSAANASQFEDVVSQSTGIYDADRYLPSAVQHDVNPARVGGIFSPGVVKPPAVYEDRDTSLTACHDDHFTKGIQ